MAVGMVTGRLVYERALKIISPHHSLPSPVDCEHGADEGPKTQEL